MEQLIVFLTLGAALVFFIWGKIRYDLVALLALFVLIIAGIVPVTEAFAGFGHPAVITVAAVLIISNALQHSGLVDVIGRLLSRAGRSQSVQILLLCTMVIFASAFMNNIGALAILMPVAIHMARKSGHPPSYLLMPLAFSSILGGLTTLIGTPPNIVIATFRANETGIPFDFFDFAPVGLLLALLGLVFISFIGWRLLPRRSAQALASDLFQIDNYITEVRVGPESKLVGATIGEMNRVAEVEVQALGLVRSNARMHAPSPQLVLLPEDILILEADADHIEAFLNNTGTRLVGGKPIRDEAKGSRDIHSMEAIVMADSVLIGQSAASMNLRARFSVNLLAIARREKRFWQGIAKTEFKLGDVLLLQGRSLNLSEAVSALQCLPLAERGISIGQPRKVVVAISIFLGAIAAVVAGLLPVEVAFMIAAVAMILTGLLPLRDMYTAIDWPIIVLLAAMIPVGEAFETSGSADLITGQILLIGHQYPLWLTLILLMVITIALSNVINNTATVVLMAPIAFNISESLQVSADPLLMTIAVGASSAFLTPIGHQSNTLVMGPGGYQFKDYWKMGLPLTLGIILLGIPLILYFWPP